MATSLPPFPVNSTPGSWAWTDWWRKLQNYISEITQVAAQSSIPSATNSGIINGPPDIVVDWVVIGNYCQVDINIPVPAGLDLISASGSINLQAITGKPVPLALGDGLCTAAAYNPSGTPGITPIPYVQSLGVGFITTVGGIVTLYLPDFTVSGNAVPGPAYDRVHITGRYNIS